MHRFYYDITFGKLLLIIVVLALMGCKKKELPKAPDDSPVFMFMGRVNDVDYNFQAGNNDYYMFTEFESSDITIQRKGHLRKTTCYMCGPGLELNFRSQPGGNLETGKQKWLTATTRVADWNTREFTAIDPEGDKSYEWNFGDGSTSMAASPTHTFPATGTYEVCLTVSNGIDCKSKVCNDVIIDTSDLNGSFKSKYVANRKFEFTAINGQYTAYKWDFGDGDTASGRTVSHTYNYAGLYEVCLMVTDNAGKQTNFCQEISANNLDYCLSRYTYQPPYDTINSERGVELLWTDKSGRKFSSLAIDKMHQGDELKIHRINDYMENGGNQTAKALELTFNVTLHAIDDYQDSIHVQTTDTAKIAVGTEE